MVVATAAERLTVREGQVIAALMSGSTRNADIAAALVISPETVHFHLASVLRKLGLSNRVALVNHAWQSGIVVDNRWIPNA